MFSLEYRLARPGGRGQNRNKIDSDLPLRPKIIVADDVIVRFDSDLDRKRADFDQRVCSDSERKIQLVRLPVVTPIRGCTNRRLRSDPIANDRLYIGQVHVWPIRIDGTQIRSN